MESTLLPPPAPEGIFGQIPDINESFSAGVFRILKEGTSLIFPNITEAAGLCMRVFAVTMLLGIVSSLKSEKNAELYGTVAVCGILILPFENLISEGLEAAKQICEYGKLLLPVMSIGLASQGGVTTATGLYAVTAALNILLSGLLSRVLFPAVIAYTGLCISSVVTDQEFLQNIADTVYAIMVWFLKILLYFFTGFLTVTGVVSGAVDASALKGAKLAISGMIPVIGGVLSDASEAVLVSLGIMKNAAGVYGLLVFLAMGLKPILRIGTQYLMLRSTSEICGVFGKNSISKLLQNFCRALGLVVALTGAVCVLMLISTVCFMKGITP